MCVCVRHKAKDGAVTTDPYAGAAVVTDHTMLIRWLVASFVGSLLGFVNLT